MLPEPRKASFVLAATHHGTLIVNRMDWRQEDDNPNASCGVGVELLETGAYQPGEIDCAVGLLALRRCYHGDGVTAIDGGANIGVHTIEWAKSMAWWGSVIAIEPQERLYYALAGNIALNNCANACALHAAIGDVTGTAMVPMPDYNKPSNFGGLSITQANDIGQELTERVPVRLLTIDSLELGRCDLIKLDIEGMELDALAGAQETVASCHPVMIIEHIKVDADRLHGFLNRHEYEFFYFGQNVIAAHRLDKCLDHIRALHKHLLRGKIEEAA